MSEFNEPWRVSYCSGVMHPHIILATQKRLNIGHLDDLPDAKRIVACVNFCRGLDTHTLEYYSTPIKDGQPLECPAMSWAQSVE